ncbi:MAG: hypothetical protein GYB65_09565 [Chloroflexi bacterium]|nr:hypothetical protein [Chloroflexota bacterium]
MIRKVVWLIILALGISVWSTGLSTAQEGGWLENFDDPGLPGWEHSPGVSVVDGTLRIEPGNFAARGGRWADFTLTMRIRRIDSEGNLLVQYRATDAASNYLRIHRSSFALGRNEAGQFTELQRSLVDTPTADWFDLTLQVSGSQHNVLLNDQPIINLMEVGDPLSPGMVILHANDVTVEVDHMTMTLDGAVPPQQAPPVQSEPLPDQPPFPIPPVEQLTWVRTGGPPGGIGYDIRYNFADPTIWYVTENYAGVHISTDNGLTWQPSNDGIPPQTGPTIDNIPIFCLTVDPHNPQIVWAGTDVTGHIYKSTDGGRTWTQKDNGITIDYAGGLTFRGFTVDPRTSDIVYAMGETAEPVTGYGLWGSGTGGVVFRTTDGGENWVKIWDGGIPSSLARYMWIDPRNPDVLYVSTGIFDRGAVGEGNPDTDPDPFGGLGILKSTDGGQTWQILGEENGLENLYVGSLYMHPDNPDVLLAATGHLVAGPAAERMMTEGRSSAGVYRTEDGGETWTQVVEPRIETITEAFSAVEMCPSDPNIAYAGSNQSIYRSADAGLTWELVSGGPPSGWGPPGVDTGWPIDLQCDPNDPNRIFANNYGGGNFLSEDGGRTWQNASDGYTGAQVREVAVDPLDPAHVFGAGRSGVWRTDDGGMTWNGVWFITPEAPLGPDWTAIEFDPSQPGRVLGSSIPGHMLAESYDGGQSWQILWPDMVNGESTIWLNAAIVDIAFAPSDPTRIYAGLLEPGCDQWHDPCAMGHGGVIISGDGGTSWTLVDHPSINGMPVFNLAVDPDNAYTVYAATEVGLLKSVDGGQTWMAVNGLPGETRVRAIAVSTTTPRRVLAGVDGYGVYVSDDGGQTWQAGIAGLEANGSLHDLLVDPTNPQIVYASDHSSGVYRSTDGGITWIRINDGLDNRAGLGLAISADGQHLYLATDGGGVFRLDLSGQAP